MSTKVQNGRFTAVELEEYRTILRGAHEGLMRQVRALSSTSLRADHQAGEELADIGSDDFMRETELTVMGEEEKRISLINLALENLKTDVESYGVCVDCDKAISTGRLKAKPYAHLCIACKSLREQNGGMPPVEQDEDLVEA
ncbi:MAG: TraR/DksA family transcriptional regulator [Lentisphaeria bacterium]|nr:TraR/DksA family transcriptional regulator [Lentisphaeria bacterium]